MHAIIMEMLKDNPDERISSADVVSRINNLIELQLRIGRSVQPNFAHNRWELRNKVERKINKSLSKNFFSVSKTKLFASNMADILKVQIIPGNVNDHHQLK
jgi:hypothetical protein